MGLSKEGSDPQISKEELLDRERGEFMYGSPDTPIKEAPPDGSTALVARSEGDKFEIPHAAPFTRTKNADGSTTILFDLPGLIPEGEALMIKLPTDKELLNAMSKEDLDLRNVELDNTIPILEMEVDINWQQ